MTKAPPRRKPTRHLSAVSSPSPTCYEPPVTSLLTALSLATLLPALSLGTPDPTPDPAPTPAPDPTPALARPWGLWLGYGFHVLILDKTPLGDQLWAAGYEPGGIGTALSLSLERYVLDWLIVGGTLDLRLLDTEREHSALSGTRLPRLESSLSRVGVGAYVQPTLCLETWGRCQREGFLFGLHVGVGAGPTLWTLRDATEAGAFLRFDIGLLWAIHADGFQIALRLLHAFAWQSELGPDRLGHPFEWTPGADLRIGWRW